MYHLVPALLLSLLITLTCARPARADAQVVSPHAPSFRNDVMPVFFRAGCNNGSCHGASNGRGGFMLSLFGYDAAGDYVRITQKTEARVDTAEPAQSLLLLKASGDDAHGGGKRFNHDSIYYKTLYDWIAAGAPDDPGTVPTPVELQLSNDQLAFEHTDQASPLRVTAKLSDGSTRDVTHLARFYSNDDNVASIDDSGRVTVIRPGNTYVFARFGRFTARTEVLVFSQAAEFKWPHLPSVNFIDELVFERLKSLRLAPSELSDDETFLRRVTLDLVGRLPSAAEYRAFMADKSRDKRADKIEQLLASTDFADFWTALWAEQLRVIGGAYAPQGTDVKAAETFYQWIRRQMRSGRPLDQFVAEMVEASGSNLVSGPVNLYTMLVHRQNFDPKAFASDVSRLFLGVQIQCAECHNHPFDRWTQNDYYGFVSFFTGLRRKPGTEPREQRIYYDPSAGPAKHPLDGRPMPPTVLGGTEPLGASGDQRAALAKWLTAPDNALFSRNLANRIWAQLFGRGVVEPVDDVRANNPASNEPLLDALATRLVAKHFDLRALVRDICNSRVYQLSSKPNTYNAADTQQFSHAHLRRLRADVLLDAIGTVTSVPRRFNGFPEGTRAIDYYPREVGDTAGPHFGDPFFATFGRSSRGTACACETKREPTLPQALHMAVGDTIRDRVFASAEWKKLIDPSASPQTIIEELFIRTLSRQPTDTELVELKKLVAEAPRDASRYEDILWSLLNSSEFAFNH